MMYRITIVLFYLQICQYNHLSSFDLMKSNRQNLYGEINIEKQQEDDYHISKKAHILVLMLFLDTSKTCRFVLMFIFGVVIVLFEHDAIEQWCNINRLSELVPTQSGNLTILYYVWQVQKNHCK